MSQEFEQAVARLPRWILLLAAAGTVAAALVSGIATAGGFLLGSVAAYLNLRLIERAANRVSRLATDTRTPEDHRPGRGTGLWVFIQFSAIVFGAIVILSFSGFSRPAAFCGFLVCPAAAILEIIYELVTLKQ